MATKTLEKRNICINCYNQHGCLTEGPLCHLLERKEVEKQLPGKELMAMRGMLGDCQKCAHFRLCWTEEVYKKVIRNK